MARTMEQDISRDTSLEQSDKIAIGHDELLEGMLETNPGVELQEIGPVQGAVVQLQLPLEGVTVTPVTVIDHPPGRAIRQASLAPKEAWRASTEQRLCYVADNGIEISLGTPQHPLGLEEAKRQIKKAGELTVLIDRLLFWFWMTRSNPRPGDGKVFRAKNGAVPVSIEELMEMLGYTKHSKLEKEDKKEGAGEKEEVDGPSEKAKRYTDGYRKEDKDRLTMHIMLLASFHVASDATEEMPFDIQGAYLNASKAHWYGAHVGYLINWGDYINAFPFPDSPGLMHIEAEIFKFERQTQQHEIRMCLYLAEAFRDQARSGTLGQPLMVPVENQPDLFRYITMEEFLAESQIAIDRVHLTQRFIPRIEQALETLIERKVVARAELATSIDKGQKGYWGRQWCSSPIIIQAPAKLLDEYQRLHPSQPAPPLLGPGKGRRGRRKA